MHYLRRYICIVATLCFGVQTAAAQPSTLKLIPTDAAIAFGVRNVDELIAKGDAFIKESGLRIPFRFSQGVQMVYRELGINSGVDYKSPTAIVLMPGAKAFRDIDKRILIVVPFTKLAQMAKNFELKPAALRAGKIVKRKNPNRGGFGFEFHYVCRHANNVLVAQNEGVIKSYLQSKKMDGVLTGKRHAQLNSQDLLFHIGPNAWEKEWESFIADMERQLSRIAHKEDKAVITQLAQSMRELRYGIVTVRIGDGLGASLFTAFDPKSKSAKDFLASFGNKGKSSSLSALPADHVLFAQAFRGDGASNVRLAKVFFTFMLGTVLESEALVSAANRANLVGVFTEVWQHLKGNRLAVYRNENELKDGLLSGIGILETADAEKFIALIRQFAKLADSKQLKLSPKQPKNDVVLIKKLLGDLDSKIYRTRKSAMTKLRLVGEPLLPFLDDVLKSPPNLEVARRVKVLQAEIVEIATKRRKELLSQNLLQRLQPTFAFARESEKINGVEVFTAYMQVAKQDRQLVPKFQQFLGPDWNRIRFAHIGNEVIVSVGSRRDLFKQALANLKEGKPGLEKSTAMDGFHKHVNPNRTVEIHVSIRTGFSLVQPTTPQQLREMRDNQALTSVSVSVEPDRMQMDFWMPMVDFKIIAPKLFGF